MDRLPIEITTNILLRLFTITLGQCKCVCKSWLQVISNPKFCFMHINQSSKTTQDFFILCGTKIYYIENNHEESFNSPFVTNAKNIDMGFDFNSFCTIVLGSCNGLLCMANTEMSPFTLPSNPIYILNPLMRQTFLLPDFDPSLRVHRCVYGFGFDVDSKEFKVVLVMFNLSESVKSEVQVHTLGTSSWRIIDNPPNVLIDVFQSGSVALPNGSLHWLSMESIERNGRISSLAKLCIVSFHLGTEEFGFVPVPNSFVIPNPDFNHSMINYGLADLGGCLSVANCSSEHSIDIWVMKSYNAQESWVKQFSIQRSFLTQWSKEPALPLYIQNKGENLLLWNSDGLVSYNRERNECTPLDLDEVERAGKQSFQVFPIVGSLIREETVCQNMQQVEENMMSSVN